MIRVRAWDRGLDYEATYRRLVREIRSIKDSRPSALRRKAYLCVLLIQLRNGSRISEAIEAFHRFCKERKRVVIVRVRKKRKEKDSERKMVLPRELRIEELLPLRPFLEGDERKVRDRIRRFCLEHLGFNTHSLRYAFITHLLRRGVSPSIIAKITKHSKLDFILEYTQEKIADEILLNL